MTDKVFLAAEWHLRRQDRRLYRNYFKRQAWDNAHPDMPSSPQGAGRYGWGTPVGKRGWYPTDEERRPCCDAIKFSYCSLQIHCTSARHIANRAGVNRTELLRAARQLRVLEALEKL